MEQATVAGDPGLDVSTAMLREETVVNAIERFRTQDLPPRERLDYWNALCENTLSRTRVDSTAAGFRAEMLRWSLGDLTLLRPRSDASVVHRAPAGDDGDETLVLHVQHHGRSQFCQAQRSTGLEVGDFVLASVHTGYRFTLSQGHELLVVEMPRKPLEERVDDLDRHLCANVPGGTFAVRLFHDFLLSLWRQGAMGPAEHGWTDGVSNVFYDLLGTALQNGSAAIAADGRLTSSLLKQAHAFIDNNLADTDLNTARIAQALGVSVRTVQTLFAKLTATPSGYILERRLLHAADRLRTDKSSSITEIAFDLGFNDSAYFSRCFRQRFGSSPRQWRSK